jgi:hypothetical protein
VAAVGRRAPAAAAAATRMAWGWVRSFWWTGLAWVGLGLALPASCFFLPSKKKW